jgi:hypothetical protein
MTPNKKICRSCRIREFGETRGGHSLNNVTAWLCPPHVGQPPNIQTPFIDEVDDLPVDCIKKLEQCVAAALEK